MVTLSLDLLPQTEVRLQKILDLYPNKENLVNEIFQHRINELKRANRNIESDLRQLELKYNISSETFYAQFEKGIFGDERDYMFWAGIYELYIGNKHELNELQ